ncbi:MULTISPECIES: class I SAM-dependent RNA methyltransferase [unclassified Ruminococcus]|uniref:THUMP domain-containing class I SAM-dependent RNA methyltransferase n=1 Tax=unclassified Ruminococcus TaxID=2608920 RepID=UPI00210A77C6|nr:MULTISPECIES: class I SAM-dependent RNA methyltransferase [unclassified Ruminococcus]MCQ4022535.1 class I SAM-dependent RNA methyltransferase [Ruminococcus sp. zg-924]MCQ4115121.1 class I SAM-dependent RNA methyltransferase [Ruminococcus sp. zg-921]
MTDKIKLAALCIFGTEGITAGELRRMGATGVEAENGRVVFDYSPQMLVRANLRCRYCERIMLLLKVFRATDFESLYQNIKSIPWEEIVVDNGQFPVNGSSLSSKLKSVPGCQKIIKKAVADRIMSVRKISHCAESGALYRIHFVAIKDTFSIMVDTSGEGLHKRGYRAQSMEAPIKETLAAVMSDLAVVKSNHTVVDPTCGSGTLLIEAALKAKNIAPGLHRTFACEKWSQIDKAVWQAERRLAVDGIITECEFVGYGYDIDENAIALAKENAEKAGVGSLLHFELRDIKDYKDTFERCTVLCNPPYGERLLDYEKAREIYKVMGKKFVRGKGKSYTIISPDDEFEKHFGSPADKRRKIYNGKLKCQIYMYYKA